MSARSPIYLDYAATTPADARVAACMAQCLTAEGVFGNPASTHAYGREARALVEDARARVAATIGARAGDIVFTSGATEADNLAILGYARGARRLAETQRQAAARGAGTVQRGPGEPLVISARTEHKAVLDPCRQLEREGFALSYLTPGTSGRIEADQLAAALRPGTLLVSLMHANNETGAIADVAAFGALCRAQGVALHVDAAQSAGKLPIDVEAMKIDLLSFTAHKLYGPKGVGALYVRQSQRAVLQPLMYGGGHERGLRSGTLAVHQIAGFAMACDLANAARDGEARRLSNLRERLWRGIADLPGVMPNSPAANCLPGILNVAFGGIEGESLLFGLPELALSSGSACNSDSDEPSYVLRALGRDREAAQSSLRFSLGRGTSAADIDTAISAVRREVLRLHTLAGVGAAMPVGAASGPASAADSPGENALPKLLSGEAGARETGTWIKVNLRIRGQTIEEARISAYGCPYTLKVCEWLSTGLQGRALGEALAGGPRAWASATGTPEERLTRLLVIEDALLGALRQAGHAGYNAA
jgi:cysteine desulfurase